MASDDSNMLCALRMLVALLLPAHAAVTRDTLREGRIGTKFCAHPKGGAKTEKPARAPPPRTPSRRSRPDRRTRHCEARGPKQSMACARRNGLLRLRLAMTARLERGDPADAADRSTWTRRRPAMAGSPLSRGRQRSPSLRPEIEPHPPVDELQAVGLHVVGRASTMPTSTILSRNPSSARLSSCRCRIEARRRNRRSRILQFGDRKGDRSSAMSGFSSLIMALALGLSP